MRPKGGGSALVNRLVVKLIFETASPTGIRLYKNFYWREFPGYINPILHTAWLDNHALTSKRNSAKYYYHEKSRFLYTFLKFCCESRKI